MSEIIKLDNPFKKYERQIIHVGQGETVERILDRELKDNKRYECEIITFINNQIITKQERAKRILKEGEYLFVVPNVAGGDDTGKMILSLVIMVASMGLGAAIGITQFSMFGVELGLMGFQVMSLVGGAMLVSALQPTPKSPSSGFIDDEQSQSFGWNPTTFQRQGISIPRAYGLNKMFGNVIAAHTEEESNTFEMTTVDETFYYRFRGSQWPEIRQVEKLIEFDPRKVNLNALFNLGIGPIREAVVSGTLKLNDENIKNLIEVYYEERRGNLRQQPISYFNQTKLEVVVGRRVISSTPITYTTKNANFNDLEIELSFPKGLFDGSGADLANNTVNVSVEIKKTTDTTWTFLANNVAITDNVGDKTIETYTTVGIFTVDYDSNYDIKVTKVTGDHDSHLFGDDLYLDKVREIIDHQFIYPRRALVGINAQATDQLSGSIRFSCLSRGLYVRTYDGSVWNIKYSNNPAWVIQDILTQPVYTGEHSPWLDLSLMLNFNGADAATATVDDSPNAFAVNFTAHAQLDDTQQKFGVTSLLLDGIDDDVNLADNNKWNVFENLVDDWIIDLFVRFADHAGTEYLISHYEDDNNRWYLVHVHGTGLVLKNVVGGVEKISISVIAGEIADNAWHHIAICKVTSGLSLADIAIIQSYDEDSSDNIDVFEVIEANNDYGNGTLTLRLLRWIFKLFSSGRLISTLTSNSGTRIGLYLDSIQIGYDLMVAGDIDTYDGSLFIGQQGDDTDWFQGHIDHIRIVKDNIFEADPDAGLNDEIIEPSFEYTDPGNSYAVSRYDGYNPSKLLTADFEELATWCDEPRINPTNFGIASISQAVHAVVVTTNNQNLKVGDTVLFRGVSTGGMVELTDGTTAEILSVTDDTTFTIDLDTSGYAAYTGAEPLLLVHFDGNEGQTVFTDEAGTHAITTIGDTEVNTANKKFGTGSGYFAGTDDALSIPDHADFDLVASAVEKWTIDFWVKFSTLSPGHRTLIGQFEDDDNYWEISYYHNDPFASDGFTFVVVSGGVEIISMSRAGRLSDYDWHHIALCKVDDEYGIYLDGVQVRYDQDASIDTFAGKLYIGSWYTAASGYIYEHVGYIDELCIIDNNRFNASPNVGLTDTITVPTAPITVGVGTVEKYQPRFTFNGVFDTSSNIWEAALSVCELCRCVPFWDGDIIRLAIDKAGSSVYAFTMGNILKDSFKQKFIPVSERASEIEVHYRDAEKDYTRMPFTLVNDDIGNTTSKTRLDLFGITDTDMANYLADFKLLQNLNLKKIATIGTEIESIVCTIGDIVDIQHDVTNWGQIGSGKDSYTGGGRIIAARREVHLELVTNWNFLNWAGGDPDDWTIVGEVGNDPEISEVGAGQAHGGSGRGMCNIYTSAGVLTGVRQDIVTVNGQAYIATLTIDNIVAGAVRLNISQVPFSVGITYTTAGVKTYNFTATRTDPNVQALRNGVTDITVSGFSIKAVNPTSTNANEVITINGDIYFDDADWQGGSTIYKLLVKSASDAAPESRTIIGVTESSVAGGTFDITVSGIYSTLSKRDDVWAAGEEDLETNKYRILDIRRTEESRAEITSIEYNPDVYAND